MAPFDPERCSIHGNRLHEIERKLDEIKSAAERIPKLEEAIGRPPNISVGDKGSGIAKSIDMLYDALKTDKLASTNKLRTTKIVAGAITGIVTTVAGVVTAYLTMGN